ncbi:armadillo-type protein [Mycena albidolilacea]|uniref:Armadillo-type protein n=1 Tax=Mycena albidolilacea TaxID=1033008 RepID=A0AAD7A5B6_9AGAR|nr:armadillo-type protein [Mycena albidolilacea]
MSANIPDDIKPAKEAIERSQAAEIARFAPSTDLWSLYLQEANERAKARFDMWNGSLGAFLLFAGLFAGVVSSFVIDSRAGLQPTPSVSLPSNSSNTNSPGTKVPVSTLAINFLWFTSLTFTLISALAAVLAQTWIVKFSLVPTQGFKGAMERWIHDDKAEQWHLHTAIAWITVLIQLALFLFLAGFAVQAVADHKSLGWTILSFVGATLVLYIGITVLPWFYPTTPFRTPFSELGTHNQNMFFSDASNVTPATKAKNRTRDMWKFIQSIWTNLGKTPDEAEVRLGICWSVLKNSSKNVSIHAAVLELSKKRITPEQSRQLVELGLPDELSYRLAHLPAGQEKAVVERMKDYLHVVMWMVDDCDKDVAQGFSPLLDCDDALLLTLDALPPVCRALAFAIRVHLLVNTSNHKKNHGTDWTAMIDSLEPDFALDVFRAAIRGLGIVNSDDDDVKPELAHLRQDCAHKISTAIIGQAQSIVDCTSFYDEDVRLAAIRTLQELAKHERFQVIIQHNMSEILRLVSDGDSSVCAAAIDFVSELAGNVSFQSAMNRNIPAFITDSFKSEAWFSDASICSSSYTRVLGQSYDKGIQNAFRDMPNWLSDPDEDVRQTAVQIVSLAAAKAKFSDTIKNAIPKIAKMFQDEDEDVRVAALNTCSELVKVQQAPLKEAISRAIPDVLLALKGSSRTQIAALDTLSTLSETDDLTTAIPTIAKLFKAEGEDATQPDVRVAALGTCSEIAKRRRAALQNAIKKIMPEILAALNSSSGWETQVAALKTISTLAESEGLCETLDDHVLDRIFAGLSDNDSDVRIQVLDTMTILASKERLHDKIKTTVRNMLPLLEDRRWTVREKALDTFAVFAQHGIFLASDDEITSHIISTLSEGDNDISTRVLNILSIAAKEGVAPVIHPEMSLVTNSLSHQNWRVRVAGLQVLESLADAIINLLDGPDEDSRVVMLQTVCSLANTEKFCTKDVFVEAIRHILPLLLSNRNAAVRMAALQIVPVISKHGKPIHCCTLTALLLKVTARKEDLAGTVEEVDEIFRTEVLKTLSDLAKNETFRGKIDIGLSESYALATKDGSWPARVAFLKLMSVLGASAKDALKSTVKQMMPDINDTLHDNENNEVRMAGVKLLSISVIKEISPSELNSLVPTLVTLLSDSEEEVRITALQTVSDLAKQDVFREAINGTLPALLEALKREEPNTRVAALRTCAALAQDAIFCDIVHRAAPKITACVKDDPDDDVQVAAMVTLSQLSREEAFRLAVSEAAPHVMSQLGNSYWSVRLEALRTLSIFAENDAFGDIMNGFFPRIVECLKDSDDDVRAEASKMLLSLVQHSVYRDSILGALQASGISPLLDLTSDHFRHVRMAVLPLILKVVELDTFPEAAAVVMSTIINLLTDDDEEMRIAALEAIRVLVEQGVSYAKELTPEIPKLTQLLKTDDSESRALTTVLLTLSAMVTQVFKDTKETKFWDAAAKVFLALASTGGGPNDKMHKISSPTVLEFVESADLDVRLLAIRVAGSFNVLDPGDDEKLHAATQKAWREVLTDIKSTSPSVIASEKLSELADYVDVFVDQQFTDVIPLITAALKDEREGIALSYLRAMLKLAADC